MKAMKGAQTKHTDLPSMAVTSHVHKQQKTKMAGLVFLILCVITVFNVKSSLAIEQPVSQRDAQVQTCNVNKSGTCAYWWTVSSTKEIPPGAPERTPYWWVNTPGDQTTKETSQRVEHDQKETSSSNTHPYWWVNTLNKEKMTYRYWWENEI